MYICNQLVDDKIKTAKGCSNNDVLISKDTKEYTPDALLETDVCSVWFEFVKYNLENYSDYFFHR